MLLLLEAYETCCNGTLKKLSINKKFNPEGMIKDLLGWVAMLSLS